MPKVTRFTVTKDHLKLLRRMYVTWYDCETGAPAIDPKRPYGNSDVYNDMHHILTGESVGLNASERMELTEREDKKYAKLHCEMDTVLQIVLFTGKFKAGTYECEEYWTDWKLVKGK
jgi:hypothetical protein